tara:strand:- start:1252 stop:1764 length:513 start_codon:yes stop_codon:yes gene_type:complete
MYQNNIFLIGMMCAGKSSLAPLLSKDLGIPYIDTDKDISSFLNLDIKEIFEQYGEEKFRILEATYFLEHIKKKQYIYATGGGIVLNKKNCSAMNKYGITILLDTPLDTIYQRFSKTSNNRPLFNIKQNKKNLISLWNKRKSLYYNCADLIIDTQQKSLNQIKEEIIKKIK